MRVIAGEKKGMNLVAPRGDTTRPITDRAKEALFNILGSRLGLPGTLPPIRVLDLFAGSGSLGIEALSRGAAHCTFYERDRGAWETLRANLTHTRLTVRAKVVRGNAWSPRGCDVSRWCSPVSDSVGLQAVDSSPTARETHETVPSNVDSAADNREVVPLYDLVFVDPPYMDARDSRRVFGLLELLKGMISTAAVIVLRYGPGEDPSEHLPDGLIEVDARRFGEMRIVLIGRG